MRPPSSLLSTDTVILTQAEVRRLLPMRACMGLMARVLASLGRDEGMNPLRSAMWLPDRSGSLGMMPGMSGDPEALGLKVVTVFPGNHGTEYDSHQGVVILFDSEVGVPTAILDASEITAIRTAAVSGVATELLARDDAQELAILGSGVQARTHLEAMLEARPFGRARIFSPSEANRNAFAERESARHGIPVEAVRSAEAAVRGADVICTVTSSSEPVLRGDWLEPGVHTNAAGSSVKSARELDTPAVVRSRLFVDRRESTLNEAGDFLFPKAEGAITDDHIVAEIGEILLGEDPGRRGPEEITLFKSLGLAVEDLAAAHYTADRARAQGVGVTVPLGGRRS
jgi:ornithine cyclodeaminase/alanine dehydrogenase-like protein (mu-crystallin family)